MVTSRTLCRWRRTARRRLRLLARRKSPSIRKKRIRSLKQASTGDSARVSRAAAVVVRARRRTARVSTRKRGRMYPGRARRWTRKNLSLRYPSSNARRRLRSASPRARRLRVYVRPRLRRRRPPRTLGRQSRAQVSLVVVIMVRTVPRHQVRVLFRDAHPVRAV